MKYKKVVILLVIFLLSIVMSTMNVSAKNITVDGNNKIIDKGTLTLSNIGKTNDTFTAVKIVDAYYDSSINVISYQFTSSFQEFLSNSDDYNTMTIDDYLNLESGGGYFSQTDLKALAGKYITYLRTRQISNDLTLVGNISKTNNVVSNVEVGSYLVLPVDLTKNKEGIEFLTYVSEIYTFYLYGPMIGNVVYEGNGGEWELKNAEIVSKRNESVGIFGMLWHGKTSSFLEAINSGVVLADSIGVQKNDSISFCVLDDENNSHAYNLPYGANEDLVQYLGGNLFTYTVKFPESVSVSLPGYAIPNAQLIKLQEVNNSLYGVFQGESVKFADFVMDEDDNSITITSYLRAAAFSWDLDVDVSKIIPSLNPNDYTEKIVVTKKYIKDPFVKLSDPPTEAELNAAFGVLEQTYDLHTLGVNIVNVNAKDEKLNGGEFKICEDQECTKVVDDQITITENGTTSFVGLSEDKDYYLVQTKVPTGYKLSSEPIKLNVGLEPDGYYNVVMVNSPIINLPFTGGSGTMIFSLIGILLIAMSVIFITVYYKKNKLAN